MPQCPRVVFLSKLKGDNIVIGMYAENTETMECQVESFKRMVDTEVLDTYEIEEFVTPYWEFEVLDKERKQTFCRLTKCPECPASTQCRGCPGTIWYEREKIKH
ncbi:MAG: hypothetical protein R6U44_09170 [Archaeoglobaceae archaeon]